MVTYAYDECNRLTLQKVVDRNGTIIAQYQYTLGKGGERTRVTETGACGNVETAYDYDKEGRLIKETIQKGEETTTYRYDYDDVGNRTKKLEDSAITKYTYNSRNQLVTEETEAGVVTYSYDANGNLLSQSGAGKAVAYTYDVYNRLIRYTEGSVKETYTYDAEGVRRSKVNGDDTIYYVSDTTGSLSYTLAETDKNGNVIATYNRADALISQVRDETTSYYLFDGHGDVRALINEEGRISDKYRYNAYGELVERSGETENHYLYTGEYYDGTSNLYYLRARYINPSTGTFISMDTYEGSIYDPDTLHKYLYANGNPVKYSDPSGNMFGAVALAGVGQQAEESKINQITFNIGMTVLKKAWATVNVQNVISLSVSYKITKILYDYFISDETDKIYNLDIVVTDVVARVVWPWEKKKEEEKAIAIDGAKEEEKNGNTYYHATSVENAALIVATGILNGSLHEGGYVFAWTSMPSKKALKLSGARNAKVAIRFTTKASFVNDWGIDDPYVKSFGPVQSYFPGPIKINNPVIIPIM